MAEPEANHGKRDPAADNSALARTLAMLPELMSELTREFMTKTDLNSRAAIRVRMKALLDLASADTKYPEAPPGLDARHRFPAGVLNPPGIPDIPAIPGFGFPQDIAAIPGAEPL